MNSLFLIDTSVWILALRKKYTPEIKSYVEKLIEEDKVVINPIIKLELLAGTRTKKEFSRLKLRLDALPEITINQDIWEEAQRMAFDLRRRGLGIPLIDIMILTCAKSSDSTLVHRDRHFEFAGKFFNVKSKSFLSNRFLTRLSKPRSV